jgi:hypothetical protein
MWDRVTPTLNGDLHRRTGMRRTLNGHFFDPTCLPDLAYRIRDRWFGPDRTPVVLREVLPDDLEFRHLILKEEGSRQGRGTRVVQRDEIVRDEYANGPDAVLQRRLVQHEALEELSPGGVAPVRVLTASDADGVRVLAVMVRIGVRGAEVVGAPHDIRLPVTRDGAIHPLGVATQHTLFSQHPVTGIAFSGQTIPHLDRALELARSLHHALPQVGLVGWDLTIGPDGRPWLLECNTVHPQVAYNEMLEGPMFTAERWERFAVTRQRPPHVGAPS